jgi:hypothetical protein
MKNIHNASTSVGQLAVIEALAPLVEAIGDPVICGKFKDEITESLSNTREQGQQLLKYKLPSGSKNHGRKQVIRITPEQLYATSLEGQFLQRLLAKPEFIDEAKRYVTPETLMDSISSDIYSLILTVYERDNALHGILDATTDPEIKRHLSLLTVYNGPKEQMHEELVQKIIHLRKKYLRSRQRECRIQMKQEPHRQEELLRLLHDYTTQLNELDGGE